MISPDAREIFAEFGKQIVGDKIPTFFGAEYTMNENIGIFVGHRDNIYKCVGLVCDGCHIRGVP